MHAREDPNPVAAAGRRRASEEGESEVASLPAEFQAPVSTSHTGKPDMATKSQSQAAFHVNLAWSCDGQPLGAAVYCTYSSP